MQAYLPKTVCCKAATRHAPATLAVTKNQTYSMFRAIAPYKNETKKNVKTKIAFLYTTVINVNGITTRPFVRMRQVGSLTCCHFQFHKAFEFIHSMYGIKLSGVKFNGKKFTLNRTYSSR